MRRVGPRWTPNQYRILYDVAATSVTALVAFAFGRWVLAMNAPWLALAPALVLLGNRAAGIYSRFRVGAGTVKAFWLSLSLAGAGLVLAVLSPHALSVVLLWLALTWSPLVLPRVFLNLDSRTRRTLLTRVVQARGPVLVVGGGGYIGVHVVEQLLASGQSVRVLDPLLHGRQPLEAFLSHPRFELVEGDATDIMKLVQAVSGASGVVHLAGLVGDPACSVDDTFTRHANIIATRMVKDIARSMGATRFVFASSCSVYGATEVEANEESELNPVSLYARSKIDSEHELIADQHESVSTTILRFATVFGHSRRPRFDLVANLFTAQAFIDGKITVTGESQWRPFIHVRDLARAVVATLKADPALVSGQIFNVGDKRLNMTIGDLAHVVQEVVAPERAAEVVIRPDATDRRNYAVSFDKIQRVLGFTASVSMADGIREIVAQFKQGAYGDYRAANYSNLEVTKQALPAFQDPVQAAHLYVPRSELAPVVRPPIG